jgi:hypothetical protein
MKNIALTPQQASDLHGSGSVVVDGKYTPGKEYTMNGIKVKCTQWFGPPVKSHFIKK